MALLKKFDAHFSMKMAELLHSGYVKIYRSELLTWFGRDRITSTVWDEFHKEWETLLEENNYESSETNSLIKRETDEFFIIINKYGFDPLTPNT